MNLYIKMIMILLVTAIILTACQSTSSDTEVMSDSEENESEPTSVDPGEHKNAKNSNKDEQERNSLKIDSTTDKKDIFIEKLQKANDEVNQLEPKDSSTYALKDVENKRYEIWDDLLNEIYGVLENQLTKEEMDLLGEEQRLWITTRDETALEVSLKYKGGTQEHLEYVAVLANLTEERCYELVEEYLS